MEIAVLESGVADRQTGVECPVESRREGAGEHWCFLQ